MLRSTSALLFLVAALAACPAPQTGEGEGEEGEGEVVDVCAARQIEWTTGPDYPVAVDHHTTFVSEVGGVPALYGIGGFDGRADVDSVFRAVITDEGLGDWDEVGVLPAGRSGNGIAVVGNDVVLAGGFTGGAFTGSVIVGHIDDDGRIDVWDDGPALPGGARFHVGVGTDGVHVVALGGVDGNGDAHDDVWIADIDEDGVLSEWRTTTSLPVARSHHGVLVTSDDDEGTFVHAILGLTGNPFQNATTNLDSWIRAPIVDGEVGAWEVVGDGLGLELATHAVDDAGGCVLVVGGGAGDAFTANDVVFKLAVEGEGSVGVDALDDPMPEALTHRHQAPLFGDRLFAVAGGFEHVPSTSVFIGKLR